MSENRSTALSVLKKCPCCQAPATTYAEGDYDAPPQLIGVTCTACDLRTLAYADRDKALAVWNRREPRKTLGDLRRELKGEAT